MEIMLPEEFEAFDELLKSKDVISASVVRKCMMSDDVELLGCVYEEVIDSKKLGQVEPKLELAEIIDFFKRYVELCMKLNQEGHTDWQHSRYEVGWDLCRWFLNFWYDDAVPRNQLADLKQWMEELYKRSDEPIRRCIECATLEHILEHENIRPFFENWGKDSILNTAYEPALAWGMAHNRPRLPNK